MGGIRPNKIEDIWNKIDVRDHDECWEWKRQRTDRNYGVACWMGKTQRAHRLVYFLTHNTWPPVVMHTCDNPPCCNPKHLKGGTYQENNEDCIKKGRRPKHINHKGTKRVGWYQKFEPEYGPLQIISAV